MAKANKGNKNLLLAVGGAIGVVVIALVAINLSGGGGSSGEFNADPNFDAAGLRDQIEEFEETGRQHVTVQVDYGEEFPTSGDHAPSPVPPGFYEDRIITEALVHSLEHGNIVIYYDQPRSDVLDQIRIWTVRYQGNWDGIVAVPHPGLGEEIILTAWTKRLRLRDFSADAAWVFIDDFRGRGPENPVR